MSVLLARAIPFRMRCDSSSGFAAVCDFVAALARNGDFVRRQLSGMLTETSDPRQVFSVRGFARALLG